MQTRKKQKPKFSMIIGEKNIFQILFIVTFVGILFRLVVLVVGTAVWLFFSSANTEMETPQRARDGAGIQGLIIYTYLGTIHIRFTPELSGPSSVEYIIDVVRQSQSNAIAEIFASDMNEGTRRPKMQEKSKSLMGYKCPECQIYRAESNLLVQGTLSKPFTPTNVKLGPCPMKNHTLKVKCPEHDSKCGCHGPIMTRGMVGWAGGQGGPDFFVNTHTLVDWWENQHTVWGIIDDEKSFLVVENMYNLPTHTDGMRMLDEKLAFSIALY